MRTIAASQRWGSLALLLLTMLLLWLGLAVPWQEQHQRYSQRLQNLADRELRLQRWLVDAPAYDALWAEGERGDGFRALLWPESNPGLAAGTLQQRLKQIVEQHGGTVSSLQALPPAADGPLTRVGLRLQYTLAPEALGRLLHDLETRTPWLFVGDMDIGINFVQVPGGVPGERRSQLRAQMTVSVLLLPEGT